MLLENGYYYRTSITNGPENLDQCFPVMIG